MLLAKTLLGIKYIVNNHAHLCYFHQERERERERVCVCDEAKSNFFCN